jgi:hypothetical protein
MDSQEGYASHYVEQACIPVCINNLYYVFSLSRLSHKYAAITINITKKMSYCKEWIAKRAQIRITLLHAVQK